MEKPVIGIIAEYNPFHKGHEWQLRHARETLHAGAVIVVLSGDFNQRGIPAIIDKYERAGLALKSGADMVIEMPAVAATSSAEIFAMTGVSILDSIGIVDKILFGAETPDTETFVSIARVLSNESFGFKRALSVYLKQGDSFPKARAKALSETVGIDFQGTGLTETKGLEAFLETPNNILGIEYVKALLRLKSEMDFVPLKRNDDFVSSSVIRGKLRLEGIEAIASDVPEATYECLKEQEESGMLTFTNDFSMLLHDNLVKNDSFTGILDAGEELSKRTIKLRDEFTDILDFARQIKTKNYTMTRVMRYLCHILLGITNTDLGILKSLDYAPYAHILGIKKGREDLLSQVYDYAQIPVFCGFKEAGEKLSQVEAMLYSKDLYAGDLRRVVNTAKSGEAVCNERSRKFLVV